MVAKINIGSNLYGALAYNQEKVDEGLGKILGANLVFGVLLGGLPKLGLPSFGLIAAIYALTLMAYGADGKFRFREGLILSSLLAVGSYLVFICLLKMQIPLWPAFLKF